MAGLPTRGNRVNVTASLSAKAQQRNLKFRRLGTSPPDDSFAG
jgi:hypothetical protein